jgi:hypothetical protein
MMKLNSAKGNEVDMATAMGTRPLRLQDMLKTAMAQSATKVNASLEAARQMDVSAEKTAEKVSGDVDHDYALKLASAIEYIADELPKEASGMGGPYSLHESKVEPGKGPGALHVMQAESSDKPIEPNGQGHVHSHQVHGGGALQKSMPAGPATQLENTMDSPAGFHGKQETAMSGGKGKTAAAIKGAFKKVAEDAEKKETEGMEAAKKGLEKAEKAHESEPENKKEGSAGNPLVDYMLTKTKVAEDAINPAQISAGAAVPPDTSASGEAGGQPVGGAPQGPSSLVGSNESARDYKRDQAYSPRKGELKQYFNEPALTMSTDKTLAEAFDHTSQAGTKFASAGVGTGTKVAAARAVLSKLAEEAEEKKSVKDKGEKKEKDSGASC